MTTARSHFSFRAILLSLVGAAIVAACASSESAAPEGDTGTPGPGSGGATAGSASASGTVGAGAGTCEGPLGAPKDPATLPACCPDFGGAHCLDSVPQELQAFVATCDGGGYCVPDDFIETGGIFTPATCTSLNGPGVCLSACIPQVQQYIEVLPQDICKPNERCVPCVSPLDNTETGACKLGFSCDDPSTSSASGSGGGAPPCDNPDTCEWDCPTPAVDPASLTPCATEVCAGGGAHCVPNALVPPDQASQLQKCDDASYCVPDELIASQGKFTPPECRSVANAEGRCLSKCLPEVAAQAANVPQSTCAATHACVPCYDPLSGEATGACTVSCDGGPKEPPVLLPKCCNDIGQCVPTSAVPADKLEKLGPDICPQDASALTCVPNVFLPGAGYTPTPCTTNFFVQLGASAEGACLPSCLPDVQDAPFVDQDGCPDQYTCVPCLKKEGFIFTSWVSTGACDPQ